MCKSRIVTCLSQGRLERAQSSDSRRTQLGAVRKSDLAHHFFPVRREPKQNFAPVLTIPCPLQHTMGLQTVHQFDGAVMTNLQALSKDAHSCRAASREAFNGQ